MSKVIWKFPLIVTDEQTVFMPEGSRLLHVAEQSGAMFMWVEVDSDAPPSHKIIRIFGTGHKMPDAPGLYVGTFMLNGGSLVFHVYEAP